MTQLRPGTVDPDKGKYVPLTQKMAGTVDPDKKTFIATVCQYNTIQVICLQNAYKINFYF